mmetsp:Transcript_40567/g.130462  ORF Transcript_40567/g.130462 Transcript_40567/m.130462 type:complete len:194 (+) Transcript_40567:90-671(+)
MAVHAQADARWPLLTQRWTESVCGSTTVDGSSVVDSLATGTTSCRSVAQSSSLASAIATPRRQRPRAAPSAPGASSSVASSRAAGSVAVASSEAGRRDVCATTLGTAAAAAPTFWSPPPAEQLQRMIDGSLTTTAWEHRAPPHRWPPPNWLVDPHEHAFHRRYNEINRKPFVQAELRPSSCSRRRVKVSDLLR